MSEALYVQPTDPRAWINGLPPAVAPQAAVLLRLFDATQADSRIRAFRIRGSIARGTGDEFSDLDTSIWISDDEYEATLVDLPALVRSIRQTLDILFETPGSPYLFVQFADGVQLELSSGRASEASGRDHGVVVLLDRDGLGTSHTSRRRRGTKAFGWAGRGWPWSTSKSISDATRFGTR